MTALSDFPHFTSSRQLFKALRTQEFEIVQRGPGYRITHPRSGEYVFIHSGSITDRSGARSKNVLKDLVNIGFLPPAAWNELQRKAARERGRAVAAGRKDKPVEEEVNVPTEAPVDTEPDPRRKYACPKCAEQRCRKCMDQELPCAFPMPVNLGRHRTTIHAEQPKDLPAGMPTAPRPTGMPRATPVQTRIDPDVIPNVVGRRIAQLKRWRDKLVIELNDIVDPLIEEAEQLRKVNQEQRELIRDMEKRANEFYDTMTKPRS